jgi:selenocysteine-specific elongation factor
VDHGKSALVEALTGTHPDRLIEEQRRQMTIELGFAWMNLQGGEEVGIVDVPGHRDFMDNMLAGIGAIDAVILAVAADEGVMPQTREHLQIVDLLGLEKGLVALTKIDLVEPEWLGLVESDVRRVLEGTSLEGSTILPVNSIKREGIEAIRVELGRLLAAAKLRPDLGRPRLAVDRVFHMSGFGTVVTGTLLDGTLSLGEEVVILPHNTPARIRGLQSHRTQLEQAVPGSRTAVNLSGVGVRDVARGDVVTRAGSYQATRRMDVELRLVSEAGTDLRHQEEVKVFLGAAHALGKARLLESAGPGAGRVWVQLELDQPLVAVRGDHVIVRRPSPAETLGGGQVVEPHAQGRHRRGDHQVVNRLEGLRRGTGEDVILQSLAGRGVMLRSEVQMAGHLAEAEFESSALALAARGEIKMLGSAEGIKDRFVAAQSDWHAAVEAVRQHLRTFHEVFPLRSGMPRGELRSRLGMEARAFQACMHAWLDESVVEEHAAGVRLAGHVVQLDPRQAASVAEVRRRFAASPYSPPMRQEVLEVAGTELLGYLIEGGILKPLGEDVLFEAETLDAMVGRVRQALGKRGRMTVAEVRDLLGSSRKYVLPLLEEMDRQSITQREGDYRRLKS